MGRVMLSLLLLIAVLSMTACTSRPGGPGEIARSAKERVSSPGVARDDLAALTGGNAEFAFDFYQAVRGADGNVFFSPYSISLALAMTYAGARGETEKQMADTLHFDLPQDRLHPAFNALDLELAARGESRKGQEEGAFRLRMANSIWGQTGYEFLDEFLDVLAQNYGVGLRLIDFVKAPEESRLAINDWASEQTEDRIKDLFPQGIINSLTRLVLANAVYFKAAWSHPFDEELTRDGAFHLLDGSQVTVPMMAQGEEFGYAEGDGYQAVELPYVGEELSMVILLPGAGRFDEFEGSLHAGRVKAIMGDLTQTSVALTMPRFTFDSAFELAETLANMGMPDAFVMGAADLSGMDGTHDLFIRQVVHKAFVSVDEAGTEAAAATGVAIALRGVAQRPVEVTIDRPFVFLIRDIQTGAVLFVGRVVNPSA